MQSNGNDTKSGWFFFTHLRRSSSTFALTHDARSSSSLASSRSLHLCPPPLLARVSPQFGKIMVLVNRVHQYSSSPFFRWMSWRYSSSKLFVGGLSYDTNEPVLKDVFEQHGEIIEVKVICDHKSGKSKGYGFVHFISMDSANKALKEMDGQLVDGRNIRIQYANKK